jgi:hypothetical protein
MLFVSLRPINSKEIIMKYLFRLLIGICAIFCTVCSCATGVTDAVAVILGTSSKAPVFLSCKAVSETEINFEFSHPVKVTSLHFSPTIQVDAVEEGSIVIVRFSGGPEPGEKLTADLLVEDNNVNTNNVLVPFRTKNDRLPSLQITELRTEYSKPKCEFIELKTTKAGNLGALRVYIASNYKNPLIYEFPSIEVADGEYITLHLRTTEENNRDELGSNLEESGGADSSPTARDLWVPGSVKLLRKTDAVYLLDQDNRVVDAVMLSENADPWWNKDYFAEAAEFLFKANAWKNPDGETCDPANAIQSTGTTVTRTICRDETLKENSGTAANWYITATNGASPGKTNNQKRYN